MRIYKDTFSGEKIHLDKGKLFVRGHSQIVRFQNCKIESLFRRRTRAEMYRRLSTDGNMQEVSEEQFKDGTRRTVMQRRGIIGAFFGVITERRSQRPEARKTARKGAIAKGKEKKATSKLEMKAEKVKSAAAGATMGARSIHRAAVRSNR